MAQLVGRNCVRCGDRIPSELDARFCPACGSPVHDRCTGSPVGSGCPTCGAPAPPGPPPAPPPPRSARPSRPGWPRRVRLFLAAFYGLAVVWGVRSVWHRHPSPLDWLCPVAGAVALAWWAFADARHRRHPIPLLARPWFVLLAGVLVPGYVIWSRGWRGLGWVVLHAALWYALATAAMHAGGLVAYGDQWLRGLGL